MNITNIRERFGIVSDLPLEPVKINSINPVEAVEAPSVPIAPPAEEIAPTAVPMTLGDAIELIATATKDKARAGYMADLMFKHCPELVSAILGGSIERQAKQLPAFDQVRHLQCSIFDNWTATAGKKPKRGQPQARAARFKTVIEVWTGDFEKLSDTNRNMKAIAELMDGPTLTKKLASLKLFQSNDQQWKAFEKRMISASKAGFLVGPLYSIQSGTHYHLDQFIAIKPECISTDKLNAKMYIHSGDQVLGLNAFAETDCHKNPLMKNCSLSARMSRTSNYWSTGVLEI